MYSSSFSHQIPFPASTNGYLRLPLHSIRIQKPQNRCAVALDELMVVMRESPSRNVVSERRLWFERIHVISDTAITVQKRSTHGLQVVQNQRANHVLPRSHRG